MTNLEKYRSLLHDGVQGLLLTSRYSRMYAAEFDIAEGVAVVSAQGARYFTDSRYIESAQKNLKGFEVVEIGLNNPMMQALFLEQNPRILDLCTGSGCIGLAIARRVKDARVTLGDVSPAALRVARQNVGSQRLSGRVKCLTIDVRQPAAPFLGTFDLIVSNPPYVTTAEMETLDPSVRDYEPHLALWGGDDGLDFYRAIVRNFTPALNPGGWLCFEFGMGQDAAVCDLLRRAGYEIAELKKDTADITRAVLARKREEG